MTFKDRSEAGVYFLGYFLGVASRQNRYGVFDKDWIELVQMATNCAGMGELSWMVELQDEQTKVENDV